MSLIAVSTEQALLMARQFVPLTSAATVVPVTGGFSGAAIWKIVDDCQAYALRCWPNPGPEKSRICGLHRLLKHVWDVGISQMAVPIRSAKDQTLLLNHHRWWQLEPWMPGAADFQQISNLKRCQAAIQLIGRWHHAARSFRPDTTEQSWFDVRFGPPPGIIERLAHLKAWNSGPALLIRKLIRESKPGLPVEPTIEGIADFVGQLAPRVVKTLEPCAMQSVALQPCLRDIWHDHLLFTGDRVTGLIDPGACRTDHVAADLSRLLGSLFEDDRSQWLTALDFYQTERNWELHDWNLLEAYHQSGVIMAGMVWLEWLLIERRVFPDPTIVQNRLEMILRRLKHLAGDSIR